MPAWIAVLLLVLALRAGAQDIALVGIGETWRYQKGVIDAPFPGWTTAEFDDSQWQSGRSGFGSAARYPEATLLSDYGLDYSTVYLRKLFQVADPGGIRWLTLRADYDDGLIVYLNGREVLRKGVPGEAGEPIAPGAVVEPHPRGTPEELDLSHAIPELRSGSNLLAVQVVGAEGSPDFAFIPELLANFTRGPFLQSTSTNATLISWKTPFPATGFVEYGTSTNAPSRASSDGAGTNHLARLTGLAAGTKYFYRVGAGDEGSGEIMSDWREFRTLQDSGPISFTVLGDSGVGTVAQYTIAEQMAESGGDLIMHLGDVIYFAFTHASADARCLSVYRDQMRTTPMFVALGNHDFYWDRQALLETFHLPTNNMTGTEHYYSFDHGEAHFTVLWSDLQMGVDYSVGSPQYQWFTNDLANTSKTWKFVFFHHVLRSSGPHQQDDYDLNGVRDEVQLRESLGQAASDFGVDIIFNGHDHCYEKCAPTAGPVTFVSGGGGTAPYPFFSHQPQSVQFHARQHFLKVHADAVEVRVEAVGLDGKPFDITHLRKELPAKQVYTAEWHSPLVESAPANDGDGNIEGQWFDFAGEPVPGALGSFSSPGRLWVNHDGTNLYLGLEEVMLGPGQDLLIFLDLPGVEGINSMQGIGNGAADPLAEGVDALDFLENLAFTNFHPSVGIILGDEYGDGASRSLLRPGAGLAGGQGAYWLEAGLPMVPGQVVQQYNRSPQRIPFQPEQNASVMEMLLPLAALPGFDAAESLKVAVLVGRTNIHAESETRTLDRGAIARRLAFSGEQVLVQGVEIVLAENTDGDGDGLAAATEERLGTDLDDPDSDRDGLPDGWEFQWRFDPLSGIGEEGGAGDPDHDQFRNEQEFLAGTDPRAADSNLRLWVQEEAEGVRIAWSTIPGRSYLLEVMQAVQGAFEPVNDASFPRVAEGAVENYFQAVTDGQEGPFYFRVRLVP